MIFLEIHKTKKPFTQRKWLLCFVYLVTELKSGFYGFCFSFEAGFL